MSVFTDAELAYLAGQGLARMATVHPDGTPQVNPVGFAYNAELDTIDITGFGMFTSRKFRNVAANGRVALVVDDIPSRDPVHVRFLEIRGTAEAVADADAGPDDGVIRIRPRRIISFGVEEIDIPRRTRSYSRRVAG